MGVSREAEGGVRRGWGVGADCWVTDLVQMLSKRERGTQGEAAPEQVESRICCTNSGQGHRETPRPSGSRSTRVRWARSSVVRKETVGRSPGQRLGLAPHHTAPHGATLRAAAPACLSHRELPES